MCKVSVTFSSLYESSYSLVGHHDEWVPFEEPPIKVIIQRKNQESITPKSVDKGCVSLARMCAVCRSRDHLAICTDYEAESLINGE